MLKCKECGNEIAGAFFAVVHRTPYKIEVFNACEGTMRESQAGIYAFGAEECVKAYFASWVKLVMRDHRKLHGPLGENV